MLINQTTKEAIWIDEAGNSIPYNRTTKSERTKEKLSYRILKEAQKVNASLVELKKMVEDAVNEVIEECRKENSVKLEGKGNYTWYNFNRSIKIETNINELIKFDEMLLESAKEKLLGLIREHTSGDDFIKSIVETAFQTNTGKLDTKRILGLKKQTERIKNEQIRMVWQEAMNLIDKSISRPDSKKYMKVFLKNSSGEYDNIQLNFSNI